MSQENVELALRYVDALDRRDVEALVAVCDPEVEFRSFFSDLLGGTFHGHTGIRDYFREFADTFEQSQIEIEQVDDQGDLVVGRLRAHALARASRVDVDWQVQFAARVRDGSLWRIAACRSEAEALEAVGLRE
jgi:ketosteroid isomerase-like protein